MIPVIRNARRIDLPAPGVGRDAETGGGSVCNGRETFPTAIEPQREARAGADDRERTVIRYNYIIYGDDPRPRQGAWHRVRLLPLRHASGIHDRIQDRRLDAGDRLQPFEER